jgi:hypothetical protein
MPRANKKEAAKKKLTHKEKVIARYREEKELFEAAQDRLDSGRGTKGDLKIVTDYLEKKERNNESYRKWMKKPGSYPNKIHNQNERRKEKTKRLKDIRRRMAKGRDITPEEIAFEQKASLAKDYKNTKRKKDRALKRNTPDGRKKVKEESQKSIERYRKRSLNKAISAAESGTATKNQRFLVFQNEEEILNNDKPENSLLSRRSIEELSGRASKKAGNANAASRARGEKHKAKSLREAIDAVEDGTASKWQTFIVFEHEKEKERVNNGKPVKKLISKEKEENTSLCKTSKNSNKRLPSESSDEEVGSSTSFDSYDYGAFDSDSFSTDSDDDYEENKNTKKRKLSTNNKTNLEIRETITLPSTPKKGKSTIDLTIESLNDDLEIRPQKIRKTLNNEKEGNTSAPPAKKRKIDPEIILLEKPKVTTLSKEKEFSTLKNKHASIQGGLNLLTINIPHFRQVMLPRDMVNSKTNKQTQDEIIQIIEPSAHDSIISKKTSRSRLSEIISYHSDRDTMDETTISGEEEFLGSDVDMSVNENRDKDKIPPRSTSGLGLGLRLNLDWGRRENSGSDSDPDEPIKLSINSGKETQIKIKKEFPKTSGYDSDSFELDLNGDPIEQQEVINKYYGLRAKIEEANCLKKTTAMRHSPFKIPEDSIAADFLTPEEIELIEKDYNNAAKDDAVIETERRPVTPPRENIQNTIEKILNTKPLGQEREIPVKQKIFSWKDNVKNQDVLKRG